MKSEYLLVLLATVFFPFLLSFDRKLGIYRHRRAMFLAIALVFVVFGAWDVAATLRGHWFFNPSYTLGITIIHLPLEEWMFFLVVPFVAIFTWESVKYFLRRGK
ncbi:MAG: lycopene cyclase domain-containing protein [Ignavibacteriae bacterium]|nr:lycopene cyclase domain-containing protein [Ignavibacteriota bacterium]